MDRSAMDHTEQMMVIGPDDQIAAHEAEQGIDAGETGPAFAVVMRGYDRLQVDDYVDHLRQWVDQADARAKSAETAATRASAELDRLRRRAASLEMGAGSAASSESVKAVGDRMERILESSLQETEQIRARAEQSAQQALREAHQRAALVVSQASTRAEELTRSAEDLLAQGQRILASAEAEAAQRIEKVTQQAGAEGRKVLEAAKQEADTMRTQAEAEVQAQRDAVARMQEQHAHALRELVGLGERIAEVCSSAATPSAESAAARSAATEQRARAAQASSSGSGQRRSSQAQRQVATGGRVVKAVR